MLLEAGQPDTGVRIATHALDNWFDSFFQAKDVERTAIAHMLENIIDIIDQGVEYKPCLGGFLLPVAGVGIRLEGAPREYLLDGGRSYRGWAPEMCPRCRWR